MTQEMTAAVAAQTAASGSMGTDSGAGGASSDAGSHAERHQALYPAERAVVSREQGLLLYRDKIGRAHV